MCYLPLNKTNQKRLLHLNVYNKSILPLNIRIMQTLNTSLTRHGQLIVYCLITPLQSLLLLCTLLHSHESQSFHKQLPDVIFNYAAPGAFQSHSHPIRDEKRDFLPNKAPNERCVLPVPVGTLLSRQSQQLLEGNQADAIHSKREKGPHLRVTLHPF